MSRSQQPVTHSLVLFEGLSRSAADKPFVVSSLQDFEASLLLLSDGKWPATIMMLWSACEKMMRAAVCEKGSPREVAAVKGDNISAFEVQGMFEASHGELSGELRSRGHELRKLRNTIAHDGASPEDDFECLHVFFRGAVNFYDATIAAALGSSISALLTKEGEWFWDIYNRTRKGVFCFKADSSDLELKAGIFFFGSAAKKIMMVNSRSKYAQPMLGYVGGHIFDSDDPHNVLGDSKTKVYKSIMKACEKLGMWCCPSWVSKSEDKQGILEKDLRIPCPVCGGDGIIGYRISSDEDATEFGCLEIFCCLDEPCIVAGRPFKSTVFNKAFFGEFLTDDVRKFLACEEVDHPYLSPYSGGY